jgi:hypothetical protein
MTKESLKWGEDHLGKEHSDVYSCINDKCSQYRVGYFDDVRYKRDIVIGVGFDPIHSEDLDYIAICQCPKCYTKYWFHIEDKEAIKLLEFHKSTLEKG